MNLRSRFLALLSLALPFIPVAAHAGLVEMSNPVTVSSTGGGGGTSGTINSATAGQGAYYSGATAISGDAGFAYNASTDTITLNGNLIATSPTGTVSGTRGYFATASTTTLTAGNLTVTATGTAATLSATAVNGGAASFTTVTAGTGTFTNVGGLLSTAAQPNVTSVGNLSSLGVTGAITATTASATNVNGQNISGTTGTFGTIAGTLSTAAQGNITSLGILTSLNTSGAISAATVNVTGTTGTVSTTFMNAGTVSATNALVGTITATTVNATGTISGSTFLGNDADSASAPAFSWANDTNTGLLNAAADTVALTAGGTERFRITGGGTPRSSMSTDLIIGVTVTNSNFPSATLHVSGTMRVTSMSTSAGLAYVCADGVGNYTSSTTTCTVSDGRLKTHIHPMRNALELVMALKPVTYNWKTDPFGPRQYGLVAQDVEKVIPQLVQTGTDGTKSVDYAKLSAVLLGAIQDQQAQIDQMQSMVGYLLLFVSILCIAVLVVIGSALVDPGGPRPRHRH